MKSSATADKSNGLRRAADAIGRWTWRHPWATAFGFPATTGAVVSAVSYGVQGLEGLVLYLTIGTLIGLALAIAWRVYQQQGRLRLEKVTVSLGGQEVEFVVSDRDKQAAWMIFIELMTRIATQPLPVGHGDLREVAVIALWLVHAGAGDPAGDGADPQRRGRDGGAARLPNAQWPPASAASKVAPATRAARESRDGR